jgi:hypothetical protein
MKRYTLSRFSHIEGLPQPPDVPEPSDGRYQPVLGTVAYDDINKRMNVTTMTGVNGKASGRLKSYKFCEGAQQFDVTLPVGDSGDFICMVTHATNAAMTNGIGVGLQSDGAGNWNLATLSGTKVTVGAPSGLTDGKTARIEIEKDITGAYWYYIYDAAGTKPTTATGKLFTTLSEGYTGWYANGNNKTYAIENISIRAESIVGRTNVEVTEDVFNSVTGEIESRTYFKPIHRGAMLETYHDGTQEVVGTTFIDDCQWDRTSEWTPNPETVITHNAAEGCVSVSRSRSSTTVERNDGLVFGDGIFEIDLNMVTPDTNLLIIDPYGPDKYRVTLYYPSSGTPLLKLQYYNGSGWSQIGSYTYTFAAGTWYTIRFEKFGTTFNVYLNGVLVITGSDSHFPSATGSMCLVGYKGTYDACEYKFRNLVIIAAESSSTNGIAACIPPIGGGGRYGVEESVYNTFTTENVNKGVYLTTAKVKTTNPNADEASLECTNDTTSITLNTTPIDVDATYTVKTTPITIDANETDTLRVSVKNSTTPSKPAIYVESLSLIPVSGDDVLYPQDLAFISGVKPSQKRKVEVK